MAKTRNTAAAKDETPATNANADKYIPEGLTRADIKKLTMQHGPLFPVVVSTPAKRHVGLFKKPTLSIMSAAAHVGAADPMKGAETMYKNCKVHVSPEAEGDDEVKLAMMGGVGRMFKHYQAEVGEAFV